MQTIIKELTRRITECEAQPQKDLAGVYIPANNDLHIELKTLKSILRFVLKQEESGCEVI